MSSYNATTTLAIKYLLADTGALGKNITGNKINALEQAVCSSANIVADNSTFQGHSSNALDITTNFSW